MNIKDARKCNEWTGCFFLYFFTFLDGFFAKYLTIFPRKVHKRVTGNRYVRKKDTEVPRSRERNAEIPAGSSKEKPRKLLGTFGMRNTKISLLSLSENYESYNFVASG